MSVSATVQFISTISEVLERNPDSAAPANRTVTHSLFNVTKTLNASSTPPVSEQASFLLAGENGTADIDLRDLLSTNGIEIDGAPYVVRYVRITNTGDDYLTIGAGVSNGHDFFGDGDVPITPGGTIALYAPGITEVISASHRIWTISSGGTNGEDIEAQVTILLGEAE